MKIGLTITISLVSIMLIGSVFYLYNSSNTNQNNLQEKADLCLKDAKICGNGSLVYRESVECEFQLCAQDVANFDYSACYERNKTCSDGSVVTVTGIGCKLSICPNAALEIEKCELTNGYRNASCVTNIAVENKDVDLCGLISPSGGSLGWGDSHECILQTYVAIGDVDNCGKLRFFNKECQEAILNETN